MLNSCLFRGGVYFLTRAFYIVVIVVVYHATIVAIGHGLLKKVWPLVIGCVLRTAGSSIIVYC